MPRPSDERLIAYLDGDLGEAERAHVAHWLERDAELRVRAARLAEGAAQLRAAFDEVLREPLPERLVAAARGDAGTVVPFRATGRQRWRQLLGDRRWWGGAAAAAAIAGLVIGAGVGYFAGSDVNLAGQPAATGPGPAIETVADAFPDNLAGYYKRYVNVNPDGAASFDKLPQNFPLPDLKPWGLEFRGARFLMVEGQPAMALVYVTENKALGPVIVVMANSTKQDTMVDFKQSGDVHVLRWRHHGHAYAIAGTASTNYLWNIHNDLAYQFDGI